MVPASTFAISPEGELLLCFARLRMEAAHRERSRRLIRAGPNWKVLLDHAATHGMGSLLYRHLAAAGQSDVPNHVFTSCWCSYELASRRNRVMADELARLTEAFESNGIPAIPYKGPTLAQSLYGDLALRQFADLDILLRHEDITAAMSLLCELGYSADYALEPEAVSALLRSRAHYHVALRHDRSGVVVELHWKSDPDFPVEAVCGQDLWRPLAANAVERGLPAAELLLILCLHGSKHRWSRLCWLVDIAELLRLEPELDWQHVQEMAKSLGAQRRLALALRLARRLLGVQVPQALILAGASASLDKVERLIIHAMFSGESNDRAMRGVDLRLYDRPMQRVRHLWNVIFEPSLFELSRWSLPRWMSFLYVPIRLARLVNKHARLLLTHA